MIHDVRSSLSANDYWSVWTASVCDVLGKISGTAFMAEVLNAEEVREQTDTLKNTGVWLRFKAENALQGEQVFGVPKADAVRLAQTLIGETLDAAQEFSRDYQDALDELFRQFAGAAALTLKSRAGGEVGLQLTGNGLAEWTPEGAWGARLKNEGALQFLLVLLIDSGLNDSLAAETTAESTQPAVQPDPPAPAKQTKGARNIDLLLDVELQVSLRFGRREMLLRDILDLNAGAVVELEQKVLEPVELLVGKKVVARGDVVVMDGHYALRVTEVLNPHDRIESLVS